MGNTASHPKVGGGSEKLTNSGNGSTKEGDTKVGDTSETGGKVANNHQDEHRYQFRKRSSVFGGGNGDGEGSLVRPEPLTERQKELLRESWKELEKNIAEVGVITFIR